MTRPASLRIMPRMIAPDRTQFVELAARYDRVPVYREILADAETPVSVLARFRDCENAFLFESMEGGQNWGRYSFVGADPRMRLAVDHAEPSAGLETLRDVYRGVRVAPVEGLPRFIGGVIGCLGYEAIGDFERMPAPKAGGDIQPRSRFLQVDQLVVFDNFRHTLKIVVCAEPARFTDAAAAYEDTLRRIDEIEATLAKPVRMPPLEPVDVPAFVSNMPADAYCAMVTRAKKYIFDGDIIQAVLSQRFSAETRVDPFHVYRAIRLLNPSPYLFFLKMGAQTLVGSSPELMVRLTGSRVEVRPIAGTRPRGATEQEDRRLADELLADEKEKAEHVMLVDLGRNDLGRVSEPGSVQVPEYMVIERYSHVMHIVSHVEGILRKEHDAYDVLRATFPAGTLSGAPKIRAMEIIHELEPDPRGVYGGAVGYIGYNGNMDFAITIRTLEATPGRMAIQAGAGIVFDSDPQKEYEETCHKARAMMRAVEMAARGLEIGAPAGR